MTPAQKATLQSIVALQRSRTTQLAEDRDRTAEQLRELLPGVTEAFINKAINFSRRAENERFRASVKAALAEARAAFDAPEPPEPGPGKEPDPGESE